MKEEGHVVGNHTSNHICMPESDERTIREEIADNANYMKEATGYEMDPFFRPPKGEYSERTLQITKNMGYTTVFWSLAYQDWNNNAQPSREQAFAKLLPRTHNGAIVLLHSTSATNAAILPELLTRWEEMGYRFATVDTLFEGDS